MFKTAFVLLKLLRIIEVLLEFVLLTTSRADLGREIAVC